TALRHEDVLTAETRQRSATEVDRSSESSRHDDVAGTVDAHRHAEVGTGSAESLAPDESPVRVVLGDEEIGRAGARQPTTTEIRGAREDAGHDDVAAAVDRDVRGTVRPGAPESTTPEVRSIRTVLDQ